MLSVCSFFLSVGRYGGTVYGWEEEVAAEGRHWMSQQVQQVCPPPHRTQTHLGNPPRNRVWLLDFDRSRQALHHTPASLEMLRGRRFNTTVHLSGGVSA